MTEAVVIPKAFISYSWTTQTHIDRVRLLAERLLQDGVDVLLDQWDLRPGDDAFAYMERTVSDQSVTKVIIISDRQYASKADTRIGGVGAETLVMSPEIYRHVEQSKFGIVATELDENGIPCVPNFLKGRIYFNFIDDQDEDYEKLLRWVHNKPLLIKPDRGAMPAYLQTQSPNASLTLTRFQRVDRLLRIGDEKAIVALKDYGDALYNQFAQSKAKAFHNPADFEEAIFDVIDSLSCAVDEYRSICNIAAKYNINIEIVDGLVDIIEKVANTMYRTDDVKSWNNNQFDAHRYSAYEMFVSFVTANLINGNFSIIAYALSKRFYVPMASNRGSSTSDYTIFLPDATSFQARNERLGTRLLSPIGEYLKQKFNDKRYFYQFISAEVVLYLRTKNEALDYARLWYPTTFVYAYDMHGPFEMFARSESSTYAMSIVPLFGVNSIDDMKALIEK